MMNGISSASGHIGQMQMQGMRQRPDPEERFNQPDADGNGGIDQTELQTMADNIAGKTGQEINVEEASATYDANNDGLLDKEEMHTMMMELRDKIGGPPDGGAPQQQGFAAYQTDEESDPTSLLLKMLGEQVEEQGQYTPFYMEA